MQEFSSSRDRTFLLYFYLRAAPSQCKNAVCQAAPYHCKNAVYHHSVCFWVRSKTLHPELTRVPIH